MTLPDPGVTTPPTDEQRRCTGCWAGQSSRQADGSGSDCENCGLPGAKPKDYIHNGTPITHYINHANTWQSVRATQ